MSEDLVLDLTPATVRVTAGGKRYILREASVDAACKYENAILGATRLGPEGKPSSIVGMADAEPLLVSMCLYVADAEGNLQLDANGNADSRTLVSLHTIRSWPHRAQADLFERLKQISPTLERKTETLDGLKKQLTETQKKIAALENGQADDPAKNSQSAMTDSSV